MSTALLPPPRTADRPPTPQAGRLCVRLVDTAGLGPHAGAWDELAAAAAEPNVFYEPWTLLPAVRHFGAGAELRFALVFAGDGSLCGLFPLERVARYRGVPLARYRLWQHLHCFLCTPLIRAGWEEACWRALLDWLPSARPGAGLLEINDVGGDGPVYGALAACLAARGRRAFEVAAHERALLRPGGDAEEYIQGTLSKENYRQLRRHARRLGELGGFACERLEDPADVEGWLGEFLDLEQGGWKGRAGTSLGSRAAERDYFLDSGRAAFRRGRLMLLRLRAGGRTVAMKCNLLAPPGSFAFKIAFDEGHARHSPGAVLELENIRRVHADGPQWMDSCARPGHFMINRLWGERRSVRTLLVSAGRWPGDLLVAALPLLRGLRRRLRRGARPGEREEGGAEHGHVGQ